MSDALQRVQRGQDLRIPAAAYNAFVDAALDLRQRQHQQGRTAQPQHRSSGLVKVKNDSGQDQNRFAVLGVDGPIFTPDSQGNLESFKNQIALVGVVPSLADHQGRFVILAEPLKVGVIGWAWAAGVCPVQMQVDDEGHRFAEATDGDASRLTSGISGTAQILWKEEGTGLKWAVIRLGGGGAAAEIPSGQYLGMVYQVVAQNQNGFDFVRGTPSLP